MRLLNIQEVKDILVGCTILGTGGGGSLEDGLKAVMSAFELGCEFKLLNFSEIKDDAWYVNPYYCGSVRPDDSSSEELGKELVSAVQILERYMGVTFDGIVSIEYGGGNTGQAMAAAAVTEKYIVDGDAAGRAVPELQFSTYYLTDKPIYPFSVATKFGDEAVFPKVRDDARAEALSRFLAVGSEGSVGMADHPIKGMELKNSIIPGALSYAGRVGRAQREAVNEGLDPVDKIIKAADGFLMFKGTVTDRTEWAVKDGFTVGTVCINDQDGNELKVWYKNENMVSWLNGEPYITCPDLICIVDSGTGYPITNPNCKAGDIVAVLAFEANELWSTSKGKSILNPKFFGFDMNCSYVKDFKL